jgi:hypothetical protein
MCRTALATAGEPAERKLVLEVLRRYPSLETLKLAAAAPQNAPKLKREAAQAVLAIAQKLADQPRDKTDEVREVLSKAPLDKVKLEIVKAEYGAGDTQQDVTERVKRHAADTQWIALPSSGYAALFGDPLPGTPKMLKIRYRIDGKLADASFGENALVVLPLPK